MILLSVNLGPLKTSVSRKTIFSEENSCVNLKVAWNELANSMKLLISVSGMVHTQKCHQCIFSKAMVLEGL